MAEAVDQGETVQPIKEAVILDSRGVKEKPRVRKETARSRQKKSRQGHSETEQQSRGGRDKQFQATSRGESYNKNPRQWKHWNGRGRGRGQGSTGRGRGQYTKQPVIESNKEITLRTKEQDLSATTVTQDAPGHENESTASNGQVEQKSSSPEKRPDQKVLDNSRKKMVSTQRREIDRPRTGQRWKEGSQHQPRRKKLNTTVQSDQLCQQLSMGTYECMVCCELVREAEQVWNCRSCFHIFHLRCVRRWAKSPAAAVDEGKLQIISLYKHSLVPAENKELGWRCPGCRNSTTVLPSVYKCFCGKVTNPEKRSRQDMSVPHSCGDLCKRKLATGESSLCKHRCQLLCHPGPCPPCPVMVNRNCPCGRSRSVMRNGGSWMISFTSLLQPSSEM